MKKLNLKNLKKIRTYRKEMTDNSIEIFLNSFLNRSENLEELLRICTNLNGSVAGAFFIKKQDTNTYECLKHIHTKLGVGIKATFDTISIVENISFGKDTGFQTSYEFKNSIAIPIMIHKDCIGILCLVDGVYSEIVLEKLSPFISISQIILSKHKLIEDYKKIYSDNTYNSKDLFLANMSHEIRTPLNGIVGYNQLLMKTSLNSTQKNYLNSMNQCSIQLMTIINDVLDFSKLSSGKMGVNTECFNATDVIDSVKDALDRRIQDKKQTCEYYITQNVPQFIILDKQKLVQIIINLVSNANKYTGIGGKIEVKIDSITEEMLQISIKDNGIGISEQEQCKLFNSFMQIHDSLCKNGTGLGLAISKKLTELLGGTISVNSALGIGSVFTFTSKFKLFEDFEQVITNDAKLLKNKKVLLIDDNTNNRIVISGMLFEWGMCPVMCASGVEALSLLSQDVYKFDFALVDICMPEMSGTELARQIKELYPFLPLIALSSLDTFENNGDFEHKLTKPVNKVQLFSIIHKLISKIQQSSVYLAEDEGNFAIKTPSNEDKKIKILVTEDVSYNRTMLVTMLKELGYSNVDEAENGKIAFEKISEAHQDRNPYDILLLDLRMPVMDGYDVINSINKKGWKFPKIIVTTASTMEFDRDKCKDSGVKFFISKPIEMTKLKEIMIHVSSK